MRACHRQVKRDSPGPVALETHDDGLVGMGCEDTARKTCITDTIADRTHGVLQIELAAVFARLITLWKLEKHIAKWHIRMLVLVSAQHLLCCCLSGGVLAPLK